MEKDSHLTEISWLGGCRDILCLHAKLSASSHDRANYYICRVDAWKYFEAKNS